MQNCHHDNRSVFRNNLEIIKMLIELWRDRLQPPTKCVYIVHTLILLSSTNTYSSVYNTCTQQNIQFKIHTYTHYYLLSTSTYVTYVLF